MTVECRACAEPALNPRAAVPLCAYHVELARSTGKQAAGLTANILGAFMRRKYPQAMELAHTAFDVLRVAQHEARDKAGRR